MSLERRDPVSGRYLLYRSQAEHSDDCKKHPFERIPRRIFLDTSVVNAMVKYSPQVFEQQSPDTLVEGLLAEDVESLMHIVAVSGRGAWEFVSSRAMLDELSQTPSERMRGWLLDYGVELVATDGGAGASQEAFAHHLSESSLLRALPDAPDRHLLAQAIAMQCDAFCTRDRATIVSKRALLPTLPTRIMTPREWWEAIRPWAAIFA